MTSLHRLTGTKPVQDPAALCGRFGQQTASWQSFVLLPRQTRIINFMPQQVSTSKRGSKQSMPSWTPSAILRKSLHPYRGLISASQSHCWVSHALPETWKFLSGGASTILTMIITFEGIDGECFCYPTFRAVEDREQTLGGWHPVDDRSGTGHGDLWISLSQTWPFAVLLIPTPPQGWIGTSIAFEDCLICPSNWVYPHPAQNCLNKQGNLVSFQPPCKKFYTGPWDFNICGSNCMTVKAVQHTIYAEEFQLDFPGDWEQCWSLHTR